MSVTVEELERAALTALPAPRVAFDGPFVVRMSQGGTGRANAASSLDAAPDAALAQRVDRIEALFAARGMPARFRCTPLDPPGLEPLLRGRGYAEKDETLVLAGGIGFGQPDGAVRFLDAPDAAWLAVIGTADYQTPVRQAEKQALPGLMATPAAWLVLQQDGTDAAAMFVAVAGRTAGIFDLAVRPEIRRRGLAQRIIGAAADWARARGAAVLWGQVAATNTASLALNQGLGLQERYRYRYLLKA